MSILTPARSRGTNRSKEDVDRFVDRIQEAERVSRGYQISLLYYEVKEYDKAKRYVKEYMAIRPRIAQTHKLLGQIEEACNRPAQAIEAYKRSLELDCKQKALIMKICELYNQVTDEDPQVLKYWYRKGESIYPSHPAIFKLKERVIAGGDGEVKDMAKLYLMEINKNQDDVTLHSKLVDVYLQSEKTLREAFKYCTEPTKFNKFLAHREWLGVVIRVFEAYEKKEQVSTDPRFQTQKLMVLIGLLYCHLTGNDLMTCVSVLHQLDQNLFSASFMSSTKPEWKAFLKECQGQFYFLFGLMLYKRAEKRQISWRDASSFAAVCFMVSGNIPLLETRSSWYKMMNADQKKMMDRLRKLSCYRLSQGGHLVLPLTEKGNLVRMKEYRGLQTGQAVNQVYELMFTLREMRNKARTSFFVMRDLFIATPLVAPSKQSLEIYDEGVFSLHEGNLQELVWVALNRFSSQEMSQKCYPLCIADKIPYYTQDTSSAAPESLCQLDIMAFFVATVKCAASGFEERCKATRFDQYQPRLLPACLSGWLCTEAQRDWWEAMYKFCHNLARDQSPKLRLTIQKGLETVRLGGTHGVSVSLVIHLARTFDERVKELRGSELVHGEELHALERRAAQYWEEATLLLSRLERNLNIPLPRDRMFIDDRPINLDENQIQDLIEQSKFSLATVAMREGQLEEAREQFLKLKLPWASYHLSQIYRTMADEIPLRNDESTNQKLALVEQSLDALYQTMEKIQGEKNHELHRKIPTDIDDCVCELENLRRSSLGVSVVDSVSRYEDARDDVSGSDEDTPSYGTPKASQETRDDSVDTVFPLSGSPTKSSTPTVNGKTPARVSFSFSERGRSRASPEKLEAKLWALEAKQQTTLDMLNELKDQLKELREERAQFRELERRMMDHILLCSSRPQAPQPYLPPPIPPPSIPIPPPSIPIPPPPIPPPHPYPSQVPSLPSQFSYAPNSWVQSSYSYTQPVSPIPGGGPMSARRPFGRGGQLRPEFEEDLYPFGEDLYEDDGSQPLPAVCPEQQLVQDWPFGHKTGVEGKSTISYSPQTSVSNRMPQPGFLANNLRGPGIQYYPTAQEQKPMPGPGFFSSPKPDAPPSASVIAQALARSASPSVTPALCSLAGQPTPSVSVGLPTTAGTVGSTLPLFGSLMAASKSPDKVTSSETGGQKEEGKFSFVSPTVSAATGFLPSQSKGTTSTSDAPASESGSVPLPFTFGAKPPAPAPTVSATASQGQAGGGPGFSFQKPVFGAVSATETTTETTAASSPFASFTGFGSSNLSSFSGLASQTEKSTSTIFGKSTTPITSPVKPVAANTSSHSTPSQSPRKRNDSMTMEEYEPNVDFKPVIDLPELVEIKSGEEEEEVLFCQRAKLFRFDADAKQWKERGIGEMKILKHRDSKKSRIMMRRDQVLKLCANHQITKDIKLSRMASSDKTWCWFANDYAEEELKLEQLAVRFKTADLAENFREVFEKCQSETEAVAPPPREQKSPEKAATSKTGISPQAGRGGDGKQMSLKELFKPKEGTWTCGTCMIPNEAAVVVCVACGTGKPGVDPKLAKEASVLKSAPKAQQPSLAEMFKPKAGSWSCESCLIQNEAAKLRCVACNALKPGVKAEDVKDEGKGSGGSLIGSQSTGKSGFTFGTSATSSGQATGGFVFGTTTTASSTGSSGGFVFGSPATSTLTSSSGGGFAFGTPTTKTSTTSASGFTFGTSAKTTTADTTSKGFSFGTPSTQTTSDKSVFSFGTPTTKPEVTSSSTTQTGSSGSGFPFGTSASKATGSSESSGFNFGGIKSTSFSFGGQPPVKEKTETASADVSSKNPESKSEPPKATISFGSTGSAGFSSGLKTFDFESNSSEQKPDSTTTDTSLSKSEETSKPQSKQENKVSGFQFSKEPVFGADSSSKSGFQFKLDSSAASTADSKDKSPFQFTFSPPKSKTTVPGSPEVDRDGMYINKDGEDDHIYFEPVITLPEKVEVVTGEEDEKVLFEHRAKLFRFHNKEWKERGLGDIKILENNQTRKIRVLMRREQILKICCNHYITPKLDLKPMPNSNGKAWTWYALDSSDDEAKFEQFSVRFKTPEIASKFKEAFDSAKQKLSGQPSTDQTPSSVAASVIYARQPSTDQTPSSVAASVIYARQPPTERTPSSPAASVTSPRLPVMLEKLLSEDDDVVLVMEEKATPAQIEKAREFMLPDHFYLYENAPPCPGCIGCEDYKEGTKISRKTKTPSPKKKQDEGTNSASFGSKSSTSNTASGGMFGTSNTASGGMFGTSNTASGGMFGTSNTASGGMFGTSVAANEGNFGSAIAAPGGMFGTASPAPGGMFGNPASVPGGNFGTSNAASGGNFGTSNAASGGNFGTSNAASGGNFGTSNTASGGMFGTSTATSGGLFSNLAAGSGDCTETTGLFGQPLGATGDIFGGGGGSSFSFSGLAANSESQSTAFKKDDTKPFSWSGAGKKLFTHEDGDEEEDDLAEGEDPHFEPVVPLPDLVEVKTGEEDYEKLFSNRAKLFRYDKDTKQWKEKGIGEMRILRHKSTGQYRLLLRREQVLKLACNQWLTPDLRFQPLQTSETAWCWVGQDFSDNEAKLEQFAVKFKSIDLAKEFKAKIDECQDNMIENPPNVSMERPSQVLTHNQQSSPQVSTQNPQSDIAASQARPEENDPEEEEEEEEDEEYEDVEEILLEKRVTFHVQEGQNWTNRGTGVLRVIYDDDVNANKVTFTSDKKEDLCNHLIAMESNIILERSHRFCEWHPIDFATDEPVRQGFRATFSSVVAAEEFLTSFQQGRTLARDSEISERDMMPRELLVPEVHGQGANDD